MTDAAPRFQFSLADVFVAIVALVYPAALTAVIDLEALDYPEIVPCIVILGLLLGFFLAIQYRRLWDSRSPWCVPPFLIFFWSLFLMPYNPHLARWQGELLFGYAPIFCAVAIGLGNQKKGGRYPVIAGAGGFLLGFLLSGLFLPPMITPRRVVNEWNASSQLKALAEAQGIYRRYDYDKDGTLEYSATMRGLFERTPGAEDLLLIDPALADADATFPSAVPKQGYLFRLLTAPGPNTPNVPQPWVDSKGNLSAAFAFVAYPAVYKKAGRKTWMMCSTGNLYRKDLGPQTEAIVKAMTAFDPDSTWENRSE